MALTEFFFARVTVIPDLQMRDFFYPAESGTDIEGSLSKAFAALDNYL